MKKKPVFKLVGSYSWDTIIDSRMMRIGECIELTEGNRRDYLCKVAQGKIRLFKEHEIELIK